MKLLLEAVIKHFLWNSEYIFQGKDWELRAYLRKALMKPSVPINKQLHLVLQNWNDIMGFMMCEMHLYREVYMAVDLSDLV